MTLCVWCVSVVWNKHPHVPVSDWVIVETGLWRPYINITSAFTVIKPMFLLRGLSQCFRLISALSFVIDRLFFKCLNFTVYSTVHIVYTMLYLLCLY